MSWFFLIFLVANCCPACHCIDQPRTTTGSDSLASGTSRPFISVTSHSQPTEPPPHHAHEYLFTVYSTVDLQISFWGGGEGGVFGFSINEDVRELQHQRKHPIGRIIATIKDVEDDKDIQSYTKQPNTESVINAQPLQDSSIDIEVVTM